MSKQMTPREAQMEIASLALTRMDVPGVTHVALTALAADTVEWAVMLTYGREDYIAEDWWYPTESEAREALSSAKRGTPHLSPRLVARRVSEPWEVADDE